MKVLGIVVEYNPFHAGHLYHLRNAIDLVKSDFTIAVMSGDFVQRGEPAIVEKFARAEMALRAGVDVVFELPVIYAIQDASGFAKGAIGILNSTNVVDDIVFGSESDDIANIEKIASLVFEEPEEFKNGLKENLKAGLSFPNARRLAISRLIDEKAEEMRYSNNILGIEYVVALKKLRSKIMPHTIKRIGSNYNDENITSVPSATAIRKAIFQGKQIESLPDFSAEILQREFSNGKGPVFFEDFFDLVREKIILLGREGLEKIYGFNEGLSERFFRAACFTKDSKSFLQLVNTKRFTITRIKRRMVYVIFEIEKSFISRSNESGPQYLRLLGFRKQSRHVLRLISDRSSIPLISNLSEFKSAIQNRNVDIALAQDQLNFDLKVSNLYKLHLKSNTNICKDDFRKPLIYEE
ncbi:MAG: nucleotidyltransferase [Thermotogae bacterium]|jgi:predicted nucleotidyltransferase|nr:nucleotidyltransferase [Thermotogota bacterium]